MRFVLASLVVVLLALPSSAGANPIAAGEGQSCRITPAGAALCWGSRGFGSLGDGLGRPDTFDPVQVSGLTSGVTHIVSSQQGGGSDATVCAVVSGAAKCWGIGNSGKLGGPTSSTVPVDIPGLGSGVTDISVSAFRACAVQSGAAKCWGGAALGDGSNAESPVPVQVTGMSSNVTQVANGWRHTCALRAGAVSCWGGANNSALGSPGPSVATPRAVTVTGPGEATAVSAGADSACAIYSGALRCWGWSVYGELGDGGANDESVTPVNVVGMNSGVTAVSGNWYTVCAIKNALLYCWGYGANGMLGNGADADSNVPVQVPGLTDVTAVATSNSHTCAVANGGTTYCWGGNSHGELGNEAVGGRSLTPVTITGSLPKAVPTPQPQPQPQPIVKPAPKPAATISTLAGKRKVSKKRQVTVATVACPAGATCAISAPKTVKVKIARKAYTVTVSAAKTLAGGKKLNVGLTLPKKAYAKLKGRSASLSIKVSATATGAATTTLVVKATIKR